MYLYLADYWKQHSVTLNEFTLSRQSCCPYVFSELTEVKTALVLVLTEITPFPRVCSATLCSMFITYQQIKTARASATG